jgi:replicative DNA helicase
MTGEQARQEIRSRYAEYLRPAKKKGTYICPLCGNGSGSDGDGMAINRKDPEKVHLKCFKCQFYGDIIELIKQEQGLSTDAEAFETARSFFNVTIDGQEDPGKVQKVQPVQEAQKVDYLPYMQQMAANLETAEGYLSSRGLSLDTARRFLLGYDMRFSQGTGGKYWRALIIPTSRNSFVARNTAADADKADRYRKAGEISIFNVKALHNAEKRPVFVTEGELDALSIIEAGGLACGLGSTSNTRQLVEHLTANPTESTLLLALDNDEAGKRATEDLEKKLTEAGKKPGIDFDAVTLYGSAKDANEALCGDPDGFRAAIQAAEAKHRPGAAMVQSFFQAISSRKYEPMPTGLEPLDNVIGGGFLRQTLVMMGAAPGMGKSFFAQQLFEGMAQKGHNTLYFNLEMSREQMLARSFARIAHTREGAEMTAIDVLQGYRWTSAQRAIIERTAAAYTAEIAPHMAYNPGGSTAQLDTILDQMNSAAQRATDAGKEAPLVVIDYLHLLRGDQREDIQTTLKRAMDAFKGYAMKYNTVVFVILAFNRESNKGGKVNQESGRDSSAIEYGADLMLGLNFAKVEDNQDSELAEKIREAAQKEGREKGQADYRLKVLKNRLQGGTGSIDLMFSGKYGLFLPRLDKRSGWQQVDVPTPFTKRI